MLSNAASARAEMAPFHLTTVTGRAISKLSIFEATFRNFGNIIYLYTIQGAVTPVLLPMTVWSPDGMNEGDVVLFCPACKHLFLRDETVVVSSSTAFVLGVSHTLIWTPGLVVVVGNLLSSCLLSGKIKRFAAI